MARETEHVLNILYSVSITKTARLFLSLRYSLFSVRIKEIHKHTAWKNSHIFKSEQLADTTMTACESMTIIVGIPDSPDSMDSPDSLDGLDRHTGAFSTEITNVCHRLFH